MGGFHVIENGKRTGKPIIWCGDLNVARDEIDLHDPANNHFSAGFTDEERYARYVREVWLMTDDCSEMTSRERYGILISSIATATKTLTDRSSPSGPTVQVTFSHKGKRIIAVGLTAGIVSHVS